MWADMLIPRSFAGWRGWRARGPHALDVEWGIHDTWVGFGIGMERMLMLINGDSNISKWCKSIAYLDGIRLKV